MNEPDTAAATGPMRLLAETLVPFSQARKLPCQPTRRQLVHWRDHGIIAADGKRVMLETLKAGSHVYTSVEAVARFIRRCSSIG